MVACCQPKLGPWLGWLLMARLHWPATWVKTSSWMSPCYLPSWSVWLPLPPPSLHTTLYIDNACRVKFSHYVHQSCSSLLYVGRTVIKLFNWFTIQLRPCVIHQLPCSPRNEHSCSLMVFLRLCRLFLSMVVFDAQNLCNPKEPSACNQELFLCRGISPLEWRLESYEGSRGGGRG